MPPEAPALEPGSVVAATWQVMNELSTTRTSVVYRVRHVRTKVECAMKLLAPRGAHIDDMTLARFEREAMATASLGSANVLRVIDFGEVSARVPFMVMELLDGLTLREVLNARREAGTPGLPPAATVAIADSVLRGLAEAHDRGLIHRSVKPANLFLHRVSRTDVIVKLVDFGVAKDLSASLTNVGDVVGTPTHMSPEQARGGELDGRSDLYSLGVVLYECLTGKLPFEARTAVAVAVLHASREPAPIGDASAQAVPESLAAVVHKALAKDLDERWDDAIAMRDALGAVTADADLRGQLTHAFKAIMPVFDSASGAASTASSAVADGQKGEPISQDTMPLARKIGGGKSRKRKESWRDDRDKLLAKTPRRVKRFSSRRKSAEPAPPPSEEKQTVLMDSLDAGDVAAELEKRQTGPQRRPAPTPNLPAIRRPSGAIGRASGGFRPRRPKTGERGPIKPEAARPRSDRRKPSARHLATKVNRFAPPQVEAATVVEPLPLDESLPTDERDTVVDGDTVEPNKGGPPTS